MNVIIPLAGEGKRFSDVGYTIPKPFILVNEKPMIQSVIENLNIDGKHIFIIQKKHSLEFNLQSFLKLLKPDCVVIEINEITEGPACTALIAEEYINEDSLVIVNCDQMIHDFDIKKLEEFVNVRKIDGVLGSFISTSNKNSYMLLDDNGKVTQIKEKIVISNIATNGLHFWKNGKDFVYSTKEMIEANEKYNGEFYIAPTYNYLINKGKHILPYFYNSHFPIGTPEDLKKYKELYGYS
jgi:dTDP-glucose pyrophosphorylase